MRPTPSLQPISIQALRGRDSSGKFPWLVAITLLFIAGCFNPSTWDKDRVAKDIKEQWAKYDVTEVALSPAADGFEGTAKDSRGETFKIKLKKDTAKKSISGTGFGDRGTELDYSVSAK